MKNFLILFTFFLISNFGFGQTQMGINEGTNSDYQKADKDINSTYQKILKEYRADPVFIKNLKIAQNILDFTFSTNRLAFIDDILA